MSSIILKEFTSIRNHIKELFTEQTRGCRRVIMGANVGARASEFLPDVQDVEIYCCPQPGAINPYALEELHERGARIFFVDRLHMKLCWVKRKGVVIGLTNLNLTSLPDESDADPVREMVVYFDDSSVINIEEVISTLQVEPLTTDNISELKEKHHLFWKTVEGIGLVPGSAQAGEQDFLEWGQEWRDEDSPPSAVTPGTSQSLEWYQYLRAQGQVKDKVLCSYDTEKSDRLANLCNCLSDEFGLGLDEELATPALEAPLQAFWSDIIASQGNAPGIKRAIKEAIKEYGLEKMIVISLVPKDKFLEILARKIQSYRRKIN